jgi:hypothetical protein
LAFEVLLLLHWDTLVLLGRLRLPANCSLLVRATLDRLAALAEGESVEGRVHLPQ